MNKKHSIKIDDEVYQKLDEFRGKRETFSQAIDRLLQLLSKVGQLRGIIEGQGNYAKWKAEQKETIPGRTTTQDSP